MPTKIFEIPVPLELCASARKRLQMILLVGGIHEIPKKHKLNVLKLKYVI